MTKNKSILEQNMAPREHNRKDEWISSMGKELVGLKEGPKTKNKSIEPEQY